MAENNKGQGLIYKNRPLRRIGNMIYYGSMADKYIVLMQIRETKKVQDLEVATRVSVELQLTAPNMRTKDRIVKKSEKDSLYSALDIGSVWLDLLTYLKRSCDHCANVAGGMLDLLNHDMNTHEHLRALKKGDEEFARDVERYSRKYVLN
jgi:hypothetical protein